MSCKNYTKCSELKFSNNLFLLNKVPYTGNCISEVHHNKNIKTSYYHNKGIRLKMFEYFTDGKTIIQEREINGNNWSFIDYYLSGKIKKTGQVSNIQAQGEWIEYYENGNIRTIKNYKNGDFDGKFIVYDINGLKMKENFYKKGKKIDTLH